MHAFRLRYAAAVSESFVDLSYRGLPLGRRIKLTQVRPSTAYLEMPTPMPVGTKIQIHTDDGLVLEALVRDLHEQVGGSDRPPGMTIAPALGDDKALEWWHAHVTLPEAEPKKRNRDRPGTVRPRTATKQTPPPTPVEVAPEPPRPPAPPPTPPPLVITEEPPEVHAARASTVPDLPPTGMDEAESIDEEVIELPRSRTLLGMAPATVPEDEAKRTLVMNALDQEALQKLAREGNDGERASRPSGDYPVIDDGLRTTAMDAVDVRALGLDPSTSGQIPAAGDDDDGDADDAPEAAAASTTSPAPEKKERGGFFRRRKKKR